MRRIRKHEAACLDAVLPRLVTTSCPCGEKGTIAERQQMRRFVATPRRAIQAERVCNFVAIFGEQLSIKRGNSLILVIVSPGGNQAPIGEPLDRGKPLASFCISRNTLLGTEFFALGIKSLKIDARCRPVSAIARPDSHEPAAGKG